MNHHRAASEYDKELDYMKKPETLENLKTFLSIIKFAVFGAATNGRRVWGALRSVGLKPVCFLDNYKTGNEEISGLHIVTPADFIRNNADYAILLGVMSEKSSAEILVQLHNLGIDPERIIKFGEIVQMFEGVDFNWANSRESEYDFHANNHVIERLAKWIGSEDMSVADLGCGQQYLKTLLLPHCKYIPVDYVSRSEDTLVCDFNENLPSLPVDVMFICGALQCVKDPARFLRWMCDHAAKKVIIRDQVYHQQTMYNKFFGYFSTPTIDDIEEIVHSQGFKTKHKDSYLQGDTEFVLMCFERI